MSASNGPGRPRDPAVDRRILEAAIALFAEVGYSGFSLEATARRAQVGKASIYLRWDDADALLHAALENWVPEDPAVDTGTVWNDLYELARAQLLVFVGDWGLAYRRLVLEGELDPTLRPWLLEVQKTQVAGARTVVHRAIERGELPADAARTPMLEALFGGAMMTVLVAPAEARADVATNAGQHAAALTDLILSGVLGRPVRGPASLESDGARPA